MKKATKNVAAAMMAMAALAVAGCKIGPEGDPVMKLAPGTAPTMGTAKVAGYYGLFMDAEGRERARHHLKAGEKLGFATTAKDLDNKTVSGSLFAVAGDLVVPVDPAATWQWRLVPETEGRDYMNLP